MGLLCGGYAGGPVPGALWECPVFAQLQAAPPSPVTEMQVLQAELPLLVSAGPGGGRGSARCDTPSVSAAARPSLLISVGPKGGREVCCSSAAAVSAAAAAGQSRSQFFCVCPDDATNPTTYWLGDMAITCMRRAAAVTALPATAAAREKVSLLQHC